MPIAGETLLLVAASVFVIAETVHLIEGRTAEMDWLFLDALLYRELTAYKEQLASGALIGKVSLIYMLTGRKRLKTRVIQTALALSGFVCRWVVAPLALLWFNRHHANTPWLASAWRTAYTWPGGLCDGSY